MTADISVRWHAYPLSNTHNVEFHQGSVFSRGEGGGSVQGCHLTCFFENVTFLRIQKTTAWQVDPSQWRQCDCCRVTDLKKASCHEISVRVFFSKVDVSI